MKIMIAVLLLSVCCFAQSAKVIALEPQDAAKVKKAVDDLKAAQHVLDELKQEISHKYVSAKPGEIVSNCASWLGEKEYYKLGWHCGEIEFSDDFKFIVPKPPEQVTSPTNTYGGGIVLSPATHTK